MRRTCYKKTPEKLKEQLLAWRKINPITGCWEWTGCILDDGYGRVGFNGKTYKVSRVSAFVFKGFDLDSESNQLHSCDNPACFNPDHLFEGTDKDNAVDRSKKGRSGDIKNEKHPRTDFSQEDIWLIRKAVELGTPRKQMAELYGHPRVTIDKIVARKNWRTLPELEVYQ